MPVLVGTVIVVGEVLHGGPSVRPAPIAIGLTAAAALWARRLAPVLTLAISGALVALLFHVDRSAGTVAVLAPAIALYSLAMRRGRPVQVLAAVAAAGAVLIAEFFHSGRPGILQTIGHLLLVAIPLLAAEAIRVHRANVSLLTERLALSERAREQEAERRAEQERMRIARELHDVVAHTLTAINVQAGSAAERAQPGEPRDALERIERTSHRAIGELRATLGVLRDHDARDQPRAPAPGLRDLPELIDRARESGLEVQLEITGDEPARISDACSLAAYRIIQESVTNARRHARGAPVRINIDFNATQLSLAVENEPGTSTNGTRDPDGAGIAGMHQRAIALGGSLRAGRTLGVFRVEAELPYQPHG